MARVKKNETAMTLEEKLERALIQDWEWPYKLPENWRWVRLGALISSSKENTSNFSTDIKYVGLEHIEKDSGKIEYGSAENVKSLKNRFCAGQILYGKLRPYLNKHGIPTFNGVCSTDILVFDTQKITIAEYINLFFDTRDFLEYTISNSRGVNLPRVSETTILEAKCPLAPLPEQQRIVDRIKSLFAKLDEAKEKAQATLDGFETRKAAILHKAFSGELTAEWREEHDTDLSEWRKCLLSDVVSEFKYGTSEKSDYDNAGMPVIRIPNIGNNGLDFTDLKYLPHNNVEAESQIHENDVLIIRSNGSRDLVGKSVRVPRLDKPYTYASFLIRIKPTPIVRSDYLVAYLNSADARSQMFKKAKSSAGINNINSKELGAITLSLPSTEEQFEIVQILENHISKEQRAKDISEAVLEQIDLIKKAILSRAFRGELGTNDPMEESSIELLKQIL